MRIRDLVEEDAEEYWALRLRALRERPDAFGAAYEESVDRPIAATQQRLREQSPDEGTFMLGAFDEAERLVGTIGLRREPWMKVRHKATVWGTYVALEARGQGVGAALMRELIARARAIPGIEQILLAVTTHNVEARALYLARGFTVYGTEPRALRLLDGRYLDEELMALRLRADEANEHDGA